MQAGLWYMQHKFKEVKSEALRALELFEKLGATDDAEVSRRVVEYIDRDIRKADSDLATPET